jgi:transcriptional regulator with XRE-family HTH domain
VTREAVHEPLRRALREGPFAMRQLAEECGLSYDVVRSWRSGRRRASPESIRRLASGLERRAERLNALATELKDLLVAPGGPRPGTTSGQAQLQGGNGGSAPGSGGGNGGTSSAHSGASSNSMSN